MKYWLNWNASQNWHLQNKKNTDINKSVLEFESDLCIGKVVWQKLPFYSWKNSDVTLFSERFMEFWGNGLRNNGWGESKPLVSVHQNWKIKIWVWMKLPGLVLNTVLRLQCRLQTFLWYSTILKAVGAMTPKKGIT